MSQAQPITPERPSGIMTVDFQGWATWLVLLEYVAFAALPYLLFPSDLTAWASIGVFLGCCLMTFVPVLRWLPFGLGSLLVSVVAYGFFCRYVRISEIHPIEGTELVYSTHPVPYLFALGVFVFAIWLHTLIVRGIRESFAEFDREWAEHDGLTEASSDPRDGGGQPA